MSRFFTSYPYLTRKGKLAPVVEVESEEAVRQVRRMYPWEHPTFTLSSYWMKPKLAPAVAVTSQKMAQDVRRAFPWDHPTFIYDWRSRAADLNGIF